MATSTAQVGTDEAMDATQLRLMHADECILVNEDDEVVGHASKLHCHLNDNINAGTALHRAFSVFLFNSKNELLLQRRSATKVTFPLVWTNTCCSHPLYTPSELDPVDNLGVRTAAQRKLQDELGIAPEEAPVDGFTVLGRILYKAPSDGRWGEHEVDYILFMRGEPRLALNPDEVDGVQFVDRQRLRDLVAKADKGEDGIKLSPWFRLCVDRFLFSWWDHLDAGTLAQAVDLHTIHKLE